MSETSIKFPRLPADFWLPKNKENIPMVNLVGDVNIHRPGILVQIVPNLKTHVLASFRNRQDADI